MADEGRRVRLSHSSMGLRPWSSAEADKKLTTEDLSRKLAPAEKGGGLAMIDNYCDCEVPES